MLLPDEVIEKAKKIRLLLTDVDGVLTDGRIIYDSDGKELKFFHVRDGHGLKLLISNGIEVGIITGRNSSIVEKRAKELGIKHIFQSVYNKAEVIDKIVALENIETEAIAYVGDDIVDLPAFKKVGFKITVPDAPLEVQKYADYITLNYPGKGAIREICEIILKSKGLWEGIIKSYLK
jgi:3-deoxy-D-manno-octulosonate 8-phosphate phosphatase (KDO 8-P phosphatase)